MDHLRFLVTVLFAAAAGVSGARADLYATGSTADRAVYGQPANGAIFRFDAPSGRFVAAFGRLQVNGAAGLAIGPDGKLYVANGNKQEILKFDPSTGAFLGVFISGDGFSPGRLVFGPRRDLYVTSGANGVRRYDYQTGALLGVLPPIGGDSVVALAFDGKGHYYVSQWSPAGPVSKYALDGTFVGEVTNRYKLDWQPTALAIGPNGNLFIGCRKLGPSAIFEYNIETGQITRRVTFEGGLSDMAFSPDGDLYVASGSNGIYRIDTKAWEFRGVFIPTGEEGFAGPVGLTFTPSASHWHLKVTTTSDSGPGSLRQAIIDANVATGDDTIVFDLPGAGPHVIELFSALPPLSSNIHIINDRGGDEAITVRRSAAVGPVRFGIFVTAPGTTSTIAGLTISNGNVREQFPADSGGGIRNDHAALTLRNCVLTDNTGSNGGAIFNDGTKFGEARLVVENCAFSTNTSAAGGAIANDGSGGGLGIAMINRCRFVENSASSGGGAIYNAGRNDGRGQLTVNNSTFDRNVSPGGVGGGLFTSGGNATAALTNCTFSRNSANSSGGAIFSERISGVSSVTLRNCTFADNTANLQPGAVGSGGTLELANTILRGGGSGQNIRNFGGTVRSLGSNLSNDAAGGDEGTAPGGFLNAGGDIRNTDPRLAAIAENGGPTRTQALLPESPAINAASEALAPARDQRGYLRAGGADIGAFEFGGTIAVTLANLSTRLRAERGDDVLIGGFIVTGAQPKKVMIRGVGPSLPVDGRLEDPSLQLFDASGKLLAANDNWLDAPNRQEIIDSSIAPAHDLESAIIIALQPGPYTATVRGADDTAGIALAEVYDLDRTSGSKLANISTRGFVRGGDDVMIGGFIVFGADSQRVIVRAIGPSLPLPGKLEDPRLELYDQHGTLLQANDDWRTDQEAEIIATTIPPPHEAESAIVRTLTPAPYTAVLRGVNDTTGVALVEVFALD